MTDFSSIPSHLSLPTAFETSKLHQVAQQLEVSFLSEMLKFSGFGEQDNSFSGSAGENHFASFHRQAIADQMVKSGGIGLAEVFYQSLLERTHAQD